MSRDAGIDALAASILGPLVRVPRHPIVLARNGLLSLAPATLTASRFAHGIEGPGAALLGGVAAHAVAPLDSPGTTGGATMLIAAGHARGWPVARGGSQSIWRAMVAMLEELGLDRVLAYNQGLAREGVAIVADAVFSNPPFFLG